MSTIAGELPVEYSAFHIIDVGCPLATPISAQNGLIAAQVGSVLILTGIHTGMIKVFLDIRESPASPDLASWDEVVEISVTTGEDGEMALIGGMSFVSLPEAPILTPAGPGEYRIMACARGRGSASGPAAGEPPEEYFIAIWPAPSAPEVIHKATDEVGARWRESIARSKARRQ